MERERSLFGWRERKRGDFEVVCALIASNEI